MKVIITKREYEKLHPLNRTKYSIIDEKDESQLFPVIHKTLRKVFK